MPFLTEELWQRLPRRPEDKTPSIVRAAYPEYIAEFDDPTAEAQYELLLACSKGVRSLMAEYAIKDEGKGTAHHFNLHRSTQILTLSLPSTAFVQALDATTHDTASANLASIKALSGKGVASISILSPTDPTPTGCAVFVASSSAAVFLEVKGRVPSIDTEIAKAQDRMKKAADGAEKQRKILAAPDFKDKVSEAVQATERGKLEDFLAMQRNYEASIEQFERLKLEDGASA